MDKATRKEVFKDLFKGTGLSFTQAVDELKIPMGTLQAYMSHLEESDTTSGPDDETLASLREVVLQRAKAVIRDGWTDEAFNPLTEAEFKRKIASTLDRQIDIEDEHGSEPLEMFRVNIVGRNGLLGAIKFPVNGRRLSEVRDQILDFAWGHYRFEARTHEPSENDIVAHKKERLRSLRKGFGITTEDISKIFKVSPSMVNNWINRSDKMANIVPPDAVLRPLQLRMQKWAHDAIIGIEADIKLGVIQKVKKPELEASDVTEMANEILSGTPLRVRKPRTATSLSKL